MNIQSLNLSCSNNWRKFLPLVRMVGGTAGLLVLTAVAWPQSTPKVLLSSVTGPATRFWSFQPVKKPTLPAVKNAAWCKMPIDRFILAMLESKGLQPAPQADRRTLIRRATFDLTGLPPTPEEVEAFVNDKSAIAWSRVVDRLLASPRYGERWGRHWLDIVRYADSYDARGIGGEGDISEAWRYRDWVVNAFNSDLPYDWFVKYQIAGDLIPPAKGGDVTGLISQSTPAAVASTTVFNPEGIIATGMLAIGNWGNGDADKDKILTDIADDQVDVVSRGVMGLTVGCARCHDHKFDPISTKDYYGLAGIFFSSHILPKLTPKGAGETPLRVPLESEEDKAKRAAYQKRTMELDTQLQGERKAQLAANAQRLLPQTATYVEAAWNYEHRPATLSSQSIEAFAQAQGLEGWALRQWRDHLGLGDYPLMLQTTTDVAGQKGLFQWRGAADCPNLLVNSADVPRVITTLTVPPRSVAVHPGPTNGVVVAWRSPISGTVAITGKVVDADPNCGNGIAWAVDLRGIGGVQELASGEFPNGGKQDFAAGKHAEGLKLVTVKAGDRLDFCVLPNGEYSCDTTVIDATISEVNRSDGKPGRSWNLTRDLLNDPLQAGKGNPHSDSYGNAAVWHFEDMADRQRDGSRSATGNPQLAAWYRAVNQKGVAREVVHAASEAYAKSFNLVDEKSPFWIRTPQDELALPAASRERIAALSGQLDALRKSPPPPVRFANGVQEGGVPESPHAGVHDVKVHIRGNYARLGDLVPRHFPVVLAGESQPPITQGSGRLQLAEWLTSPTHPLTARVWVNRVWQNHFGQGIVHTPSNFGKLGEAPTHPELLDWLAWNFEHAPDAGNEMGWSTKRLHRLILLSATYQQSSEALPATLKADPDNRWFGRFNRQRLEAEQVRDNMLAVAGRLDTTMGGVAFREFNTPRRTLYLMIVRSDRSGFGPLFDGADSTACVDRRTVSTVAPQSLYLLNNPFVLEQTRALAARLIKEIPEGAANDSARIRRAYQLLYGRAPSVEEIAVGARFLLKARSQSLTPTASATAPAPKSMEQTTGTTAWERYCQVLLCANEFMYVD